MRFKEFLQSFPNINFYGIPYYDLLMEYASMGADHTYIPEADLTEEEIEKLEKEGLTIELQSYIGEYKISWN